VSDDQVYLLFALEEPSSDVVPQVESLVRELNEDREWLCGEIALINDRHEDSVVQEGDGLWTLGGMLPLARPTANMAVERAQLADVEFLIERLIVFSRSGGSLVIEYSSEEEA
jgi:hypothetical protein